MIVHDINVDTEKLDNLIYFPVRDSKQSVSAGKRFLHILLCQKINTYKKCDFKTGTVRKTE